MSNGQVGIKWRFLIVEDNDEIIRLLKEIVPACVDPPDEVEADVCKKFAEAAVRLRSERFDLLILDLKDDSSEWLGSEDDPAGLKIFEELKKNALRSGSFLHRFRAQGAR